MRDDFLAYSAERDIDLLLLEEMHVNAEFCSWVYSAFTSSADPAPRFVDGWHSVSHPTLGESDLVILYDNGMALLIENKIDAPAQPEQPERYRRRGAIGVEDGHWERFITCMVAPERYIAGNSEADRYDTRVSYEQIHEWFVARDDPRSQYRAKVLAFATEQGKRGYVSVPDDDVSQLWELYWEFASEAFAVLEMPRPDKKPARSDWPIFRPRELRDSLGANVRIVHKMDKGYVDLEVGSSASDLDRIQASLGDEASSVRDDFRVVSAGKSAAVRIEVPRVDRFRPFDAQKDRVVAALQAASDLLTISTWL